ncbi:hypothetical protein [Salinispora arenicola]|uniref:hypothetical protein n=1 Tax=Salinispora arenicola TaxID=168697 RepID=UPI00036923C1|nr:hypothetical protein [Salinispora arenicola]NIL59991.1 hypothetical protein [Salinispora arenicola]NIL64539.1 hypothetical protein [Salinispora arenicola]
MTPSGPPTENPGLQVEDPADPGHGFLVIWVARSAGAPHAFSPQGSGRHYPRRVGTEKNWLSEAEIAEAYRARFAGLAERLDLADKIETDFLKRLSTDQTFVIVTLVPDLPGMFTIDNEAPKPSPLPTSTNTSSRWVSR